MKRLRKMVGCLCMRGIIVLGSLLFFAQAYAGHYPPGIRSVESEQVLQSNDFSSPEFFWPDNEFFPEWQKLMEGIAAAERSENVSPSKFTLNALSQQELLCQHLFLEHETGVSVSRYPRATTFQITLYTLQRLRDAGVPIELLSQLEFIEGCQFAEQDEFWEAIEQYIDSEMLLKYQTAILTYAMTNSEDLMLKTGTDLHDMLSAHYSLGSQENIASWNTFLYYPKSIKNALSPSGNKSVMPKTSHDQNENNDVLNIRALLKRWGIPKPSTLILIGLALYLLLALVSRR